MSGSDRRPIPGGTVSAIRGRYQSPALAWLTRIVLVVAALGAVLPGPAGIAVATTAVVAVVVTPLVRVAWLIMRWRHERDQRFVALGVALLGVVAVGGVLAGFGVGS